MSSYSATFYPLANDSLRLPPFELSRAELVKLQGVLKPYRATGSVILSRTPVGRSAIGYSIIKLTIVRHSMVACFETRDALRATLRDARIPGFYQLCTNCCRADLAPEYPLPDGPQPCTNPDLCVGRITT